MEMSKWYYTPAQVAPLLKWDAHYIRIMAENEPERLPFETVRHKRRTQIPKKPFDEWYLRAGGSPEALKTIDDD